MNIAEASLTPTQPNNFATSDASTSKTSARVGIPKFLVFSFRAFVPLITYRDGSSEPDLNARSKIKYSELFESYFLKSFSSRLAEYTNPEIEVRGKEVLNKNYTIVNSLLIGTTDRPEVKIDWRIYTKNSNNPLIRDLIIEGLSLARTQKEEFSSILNSNDGDINILFKTLEEFSKN